MKSKTAVLLIQLGTPDSPSTGDVRRYLREFLSDGRVIDIPWLPRMLLVNLIIAPFRAPKSAKIYKRVWTDKGSPLLINSESLRAKLQAELGGEIDVHLAMRYKNPGLEEVLEKMRREHYGKILLFPLFPQYASATTGSALEKALKIIRKWYLIPEIRVLSQFYYDKGYLDCVAEQARKFDIPEYDHVLFSYHGLPERQVDKVYEDGKCSDHNCDAEVTPENEYCYKAACYETTRQIANRLKIPDGKYTVCFQSRLSKDWLQPFADDVIIERAKNGDKKLLVFSPAFVADCLETLIEIGEEYQHLFTEHGGEKVQLVPSLNDSESWVKAVKNLVCNLLPIV